MRRGWGYGPKPPGWKSLSWEERFTRCPVHGRYIQYKHAYRPLCVTPAYPSSPDTCCCPTPLLKES